MNEPVDTTVITLDTVDYGSGATDRVVFHDCKFRTEDHGTLVVYPANDPDKVGNVAIFAPGSWASVIRGTVVALGNDETGTTVGKHELKAVQS